MSRDARQREGGFFLEKMLSNQYLRNRKPFVKFFVTNSAKSYNVAADVHLRV